MRYYILFFALISSLSIYSQVSEDVFVERYKLDFSIPDNPASKLLGIETSNLLKPSKAQMISFITSEIFNFNSLSVPNSFGAEITPVLLLNQKTAAIDYNALLYSFRISFATTRNDSGNSKLSMGLRTTLIDKGDIIESKTVNDQINELLKENELLKDGIRKEYELKIKVNFTNAKNKEDSIKARTDYINNKEVYVAEKMASKTFLRDVINDKKIDYADYNDYLNKKLEIIKKNYVDSNWNNLKWDVAYAILGQSKDSLVKNINFSRHSLWTTITFGIGYWNLNMIGLNFQYDKEDKRPDWSLNGRFYAGVNKAKGFLEAQYMYKGKDTLNSNNYTNNFFLNLGAEINIFGDFWATYYAGVKFNKLGENMEKSFDSHFDIRYGLP